MGLAPIKQPPSVNPDASIPFRCIKSVDNESY